MSGRRADHTGGGGRGLQVYYLATPLFWVADALVGTPVRVALDSGALRLAYYGSAFLLGLAIRKRPALAPWIGMGESAVNLTLLMVALFDAVYGTAFPDPEIVMGRTVNLALAGGVLLFGFYRSQAALAGRRRSPFTGDGSE